ncbi:hypothetical protein [Telluribacter humicola]|uniref:hypothetical protein n=1 Tax=Telluribacter humicola TaxID=1720261 RepID=UPI001A95EDC8|nr:hypothetical protein [Telluribacter humicola]
MKQVQTIFSLSEQYYRLCQWIEEKLDTPHWLLYLTLFCAILSWFLAVPPYTILAGADAWAFVKIQAQDILHPYGYEVYIRRENMVMRWVLPLLSYLTGHNVIFIVVIQGLLGCAFLYLMAREVFQQTADKVVTAFFALALSNMFVFSWFLVDMAGYGDGFAYFFLLLALFVRNPFLLFVCLQLAFFTDERAIVAGGYVILWWMARTLVAQKEASTLESVAKSAFIPATWVVISAWILYFIFRRYIMSTYFSFHEYTTEGTPVLFADDHRAGLGNSLWTSFEGAWLLLGAAGYVLYKAQQRWLLVALLTGFLVLITTGIFVHDIDRAYGYGFPFLLISSLVLAKMVPLPEYRKLLFVMALICVIHPMCYTLGYNKVVWAEPLPLKAVMFLDRWTGWGWFN